ncbi:ABC transporter substrate-binding protein [Nonomuraea angiospora]|uniref:ABC transporter substrate-binding protein n=1 Tax=Nonomuraea angiospora TaxID=46172 RepID=UPI0029A56B92|nr:extracellular solute-binding protein [Nonomuraea angiospora]MDX3104121.1 extracellular solute-binding protein [Nonomuraea angiospora]
MKMRTPVVGSLLLATITLAACSTAPPGGSAPASTASGGAVSGTLTMIYSSTFKEALTPVVKAFEQKYPGTKVDVSYSGDDVMSVISTQLQAGTAPDLFISLPGRSVAMGVGLLGSQGKLLDLTDSPWAAGVPRLWRDDLSDKGKLYAYPGTLQGLGGIYNQTKLKELGLEVPKTWSEVLQFCKSAKDHGVYAYAQGFNDAAGPQMMYLVLSSTLVYGPTPDFTQQVRDGKTTLAASPWKQVLEKYKQMYDAGCFGEGALGRTRSQGGDEVAAGKALAVAEVGAGLTPIQKAAPSSEFVMAPIPATDNPADTYMPALPGFTLSGNAQAKNPAAAKAFLNLLAEPGHINEYSKAYMSVPAIPNDAFQPPAVLASFNEAVAAGKSTKLPDWGNPKVNEVAQQGIQAILLGKDTVDGVLQKMQESLEG